jgi:hypothetical protein
MKASLRRRMALSGAPVACASVSKGPVALRERATIAAYLISWSGPWQQFSPE